MELLCVNLFLDDWEFVHRWVQSSLDQICISILTIEIMKHTQPTMIAWKSTATLTGLGYIPGRSVIGGEFACFRNDCCWNRANTGDTGRQVLKKKLFYLRWRISWIWVSSTRLAIWYVFACEVWCIAGVPSISPSSEQTGEVVQQKYILER